ncbi:hypothetical protein Ciccas_010931 [Cichlidogyrus casuarinus]|uniref:Uncharacterized protein n=1 Tax=Cichlidogyrus casuarinus TaxID=1844966 RepID=A0ABD2PT47_9PLAT
MRQLSVVAIISLLFIGTKSQSLRPFCLPYNITDSSNNCFNQCKSKQCAWAFNVISKLINCYDSSLRLALAFAPGLSADQKQLITNFVNYDINNLKTISTNALSTMPTQFELFFVNLVTTSATSLTAIIDTLNNVKNIINTYQGGVCTNEANVFQDLIAEYKLYGVRPTSDASQQHASFLSYMALLAILLHLY